MTRLLLRLMGAAMLLWGMALGGTMVAGRMMPPVPLAVFMTMTHRSDLLISRLDTRLKVVAGQWIKNVGEYPYAIDSQCRVLFPLRLSSTLKLAYLDLKTDERRSYTSEYNPTGYAEWLPDKYRVWAQYTAGPEQVRQYGIVDTLSGETVPVPLASLEREAPVSLIWSPDSAYGVISGWRSMQSRYTYVVDTAAGSLTPIAATQSHIFRWSPDSRYLVALAADHLLVLDVQTMTPARRFERIHYGIGMAWTPDNRLLFLAQQPGSPEQYQGYAWQPRTNRLQAIAVNLPAFNFSYSIQSAAWSPDGSKILYEDRHNLVHILDTASGEEVAYLPPPDSDGYRVHFWSPDGRYVVSYNNFPQTLVFTDTTSNEKIFFPVNIDLNTLAGFALAWQTTPEPGLFERRTSTLKRLIFVNDKPDLITEFHLPGAYLAAFCDPEETAP